MVLDNQCVAGMPNMITLDPNQFRPLPSAPTDVLAEGALRKECHLCSQMVLVKINEPRKGYFVWHKSSIKGHVPQRFKGNGKPARVRGRRQ